MANIDFPKTDSSAEQLAKQIVFGLIGVLKKLHLYFDSHTVYQNSLEILIKLFADYFTQHGNLRLSIERRNILYDDALLYEGKPEATDLAHLLHRDGFLWLEFQKGLQLWELDTFLKIFRDHGVLDEDPADDIATALWAINLSTILYEVADLEIGLQSDIDFSQFPCTDDSSADKTDDAEGGGTSEGPTVTPYSIFASNVLSQENPDELWELTEDERDQLRQMIADEEKLDGSDYVIDALLYILENHCLEEDITELLETMKQELFEALANARFEYLFEAYRRLKKTAQGLSAPKKWLLPYLNRFFSMLETEAFLKGLLRDTLSGRRFEKTEVLAIKRLLLQFDPRTTAILAPMVTKIPSAILSKAVLEVVGSMARLNFQHLESLIRQAEPALTARLVPILGFLNDRRSRQVLSRLLKHPSASIRLKALNAVLRRDDNTIEESKFLKEAFSLIDDSDDKVRHQVLQRLGRERSVVVENMLLAYLQQDGRGRKNRAHFIPLCQTLGRCGSERSEPYLTHLLFKWPRIGLLRSAGSTERQGALAALNGLNTETAKQLIDRQKSGFWKNIFRNAGMSTASTGKVEML